MGNMIASSPQAAIMRKEVSKMVSSNNMFKPFNSQSWLHSSGQVDNTIAKLESKWPTQM